MSLKRLLAGRICGMRSRARSVLSSASVKSSVNQPVMATPSMLLVVLREANSGRSATSVVASRTEPSGFRIAIAFS